MSRLAEAFLDLALDRLGLFTRHHFSFARERATGLLLELGHTRSWIRISAEQSYQALRDEYLKQRRTLREVTQLKKDKDRELTRNTYERQVSPPKTYNQAKVEELRRMLEIRRDAIQQEMNSAKEREANCIALISVLQKKYYEEIENQRLALLHAVRKFTRAEEILLSLGFQANQVRNLYLEKIKLVSTGAKLLILPEDQQVFPPGVGEFVSELRVQVTKELKRRFAESGGPQYFKIGWAALESLGAVSEGDHFWEAIHRRQKSSLETLAALLDIEVSRA